MSEKIPLPLTSRLAPEGLTARARALVAVSVERVLSRQGDPDAEIRRFGEDGVRHVIEAHWISRKAPNGVPVKLAKCGSLERLHAEADKAMRAEAQRAIARLDPAQAGEGEEVEMVLGGGWTIVRLLTSDALDRESARMGHCVGNGAYDEKVEKGETKIFSLRSPGGKSRLTIEIGKSVQVQARENATPDAETHALVRALFEKHGRADDYWADRIRSIIKERVPGEEPFIRRSAQAASEYARKIINGRWPEAESVIATVPWIAYEYARDVIKDRWLEAEMVIATRPNAAYGYARDVINGRWSVAESVIATDPNVAYWYVKEVIKRPWPEAESVIATFPYTAYWYAKEFLKRRWEEAENVIASDPESAYGYARDVIKDRWTAAETLMSQDPYWVHRYERTFKCQIRERYEHSPA